MDGGERKRMNREVFDMYYTDVTTDLANILLDREINQKEVLTDILYSLQVILDYLSREV